MGVTPPSMEVTIMEDNVFSRVPTQDFPHTVNPRISPRGLICIEKILHGGWELIWLNKNSYGGLFGSGRGHMKA